MWMRLGLLLTAILASFALTGAGQARPATSGPEDEAAARAVAAMTGLHDAAAHAAVPPDFEAVMGYTPEWVTDPDGSSHLIAPDGDCSTPFGVTTYDFGRACKTHDYGYDLLRYATAKDGELGPWARIALDDLLGQELRDRCSAIRADGFCWALAGAGESAVKANSWRQGHGNPGTEDPAPYLAAGALVVAALAGPTVATACVRRVRT